MLAQNIFDSDYVEALSQRDPAIEAHFVDHFGPILMRTLRRKVRSIDQARDIRQETFLRVLVAVRSGKGVRHPERFAAFVMGVCNNIVRETYREQRLSAALSTLQTEPVADLPSAYMLTVAEETRRMARRVLSRLDVSEQGILEAMLLEKQSRDVICRQLGVSRSYLRVLLCRAKKRFRVQAGREPSRTSLRNLLPARSA
jgi:RNA polymerase sigma-70 factor (ECF subfamily)